MVKIRPFGQVTLDDCLHACNCDAPSVLGNFT